MDFFAAPDYKANLVVLHDDFDVGKSRLTSLNIVNDKCKKTPIDNTWIVTNQESRFMRSWPTVLAFKNGIS
jgi:hypothetical protein